MDCAVQSTEAKARRKEEKRKLRAQQNVALEAGGKDGGDDDSRDQDSDDAEGEEGDFDGVAMLAEPMKRPSKSTRGIPAANSISSSASASTTEASRAPLLLNPDLPHLAAVLDKADVVIEVLDARDPLAHRSHALEARVASKEGQKLLLVLNKIGACAHTHSDVLVVIAHRSTIDACPREPTAAWATHLRSEHPTLFFRVGSSFLPPPVTYDPKKGKGKSKEPSDDAWGLDAVSKLLGQWAQEKTDGGPLHVAVVGLSNVRSCSFSFSLRSTPAL
jgi:nuclear GTP-binding protein